MSIRIRRWKCALLLKLSLVFLLESVVWHSSSDNNCSRFGATAATATIRTTATSMSGFDKEMDHSTRSLASESWEKELNTNNKEATKEDEEMFETWLEDVEAAQATSEPSPASANNFGQWLTDVETFQQQTPEPTPAPNTEKPTRLPTTKRPTTQKPTFPPQSEDTPTGGIPSFFPPFDNVPFSTFEPVPTPTAPRPVAPQRVPTSRPQRAPTNQPQRVPTNQPQRAPTSRPQPLPTEAPIEPTQTPVAPAPVSKAPVTQAPVTQTPITPAPAVVNVTGAPIAVTGAPVAIPTTLPPNVTAAPASVPPGVLVDETVTGISIEYKNVSNLSEDDLVQLVLVTETWFNEYWGSRENNRRSRRLQENATVIRGMNTTMIIVSQNSTASPNNNVVSFSQQLRYELVGGQDKPTAESLIVSTFEDKSANTDYHRRLQATILPAFANVASPIPLPLLTSIPAPTAPTPAAPTAPTPVAPSAPEVPTDDDDGLSVGALIVIIAAAIVGVGVGAYALFSRTKGAPLADASRPDAASSLIGGGDGMSVVSRVSGTQAKAQQRPSALDVSTLSQNPTVLSANLSGKAQLVPLDDDDDIDIEGASGYNDTDELNSYAGKSADTSDFDYSQVAREAAALPPADTGLSPVGAAGVAAAGFGGAALAGAALSRSGDQSKSNTNESMSLDDDGLGGATTSSRTGSKYADSDLPIEEDHFVIYAPAGKLGLVVDNPDDGAPVVHAIKEDSVLIDQVRVGDRLVGVDEIDVRSLSPVKVSKLISKRSTNPLRKLTLVRSKLDLDDDVTDVTESGISSAQASTNLETDTLMTEEKRELLRDNDNDDASSNVGSMSHLSADEDHNSIGFHDDNASFVDGMSQTGEIQDGTDDSVDVESSAKLDP